MWLLHVQTMPRIAMVLQSRSNYYRFPALKERYEEWLLDFYGHLP